MTTDFDRLFDRSATFADDDPLAPVHAFFVEVRDTFGRLPAPEPRGDLAARFRDESEGAAVLPLRPPQWTAGTRARRFRRALLVAATLAVAVATTGGLAAAGALPDSMQNTVSDFLDRVGIDVPRIRPRRHLRRSPRRPIPLRRVARRPPRPTGTFRPHPRRLSPAYRRRFRSSRRIPGARAASRRADPPTSSRRTGCRLHSRRFRRSPAVPAVPQNPEVPIPESRRSPRSPPSLPVAAGPEGGCRRLPPTCRCRHPQTGSSRRPAGTPGDVSLPPQARAPRDGPPGPPSDVQLPPQARVPGR